MRIFISDIVGKHILKSDKTLTLGRIKRIIIDPDTGKMLAFALDKSLSRFVATTDLIFDDKIHAFRSCSEDPEISRDEIMRLDKLLTEKRFFSKQKVKNEDNKFLGYLSDIEIDTTLCVLTQILVQKRILIFKKKLLLPRSHILEVTKSIIRVKGGEARAPLFQKEAEPITGSAS
jgi:sporulation protein YlmC with PRC-barrel domain